MAEIALICLAASSFGAWIYLLACRGGFWRAAERLDGAPRSLRDWPPVVALVPARDEAGVIGQSLPSLLGQDYPGSLRVILIDDHSTDGTADRALKAARDAGQAARLTVAQSRPLPPGWTGKVWALAEGLEEARRLALAGRYIWLTDADIAHDPVNLRRLAAKAEDGDLDLVSQMVVLVSEGFWARLLIPAFVFFFQKLYPFAWVNDPANSTAAAAGGCVLLRREALERVDGFHGMQDALIDDCALARLIKRQGRDGGGRIWLGLTTAAESLRPYHGLAGIWRMVARSAYTQLGYSALLLAGTTVAMAVLYWAPPMLAVYGLLVDAPAVGLSGAVVWLLMTGAFLPILVFYRQSTWLAPLLPLAGFLYSLMTLASAVAYWRGRGGAWKGRTLAAGAVGQEEDSA